MLRGGQGRSPRDVRESAQALGALLLLALLLLALLVVAGCYA